MQQRKIAPTLHRIDGQPISTLNFVKLCAIRATLAPGTSFSSTIPRFSSTDHRLRPIREASSFNRTSGQRGTPNAYHTPDFFSIKAITLAEAETTSTVLGVAGGFLLCAWRPLYKDAAEQKSCDSCATALKLPRVRERAEFPLAPSPLQRAFLLDHLCHYSQFHVQ